ncbi:TrmH family RNA methyltransferase [Natranaerobius trueperi]|uniref:RNA 2-O ribose methyltransferase substrate binding domain-containing protein n=1 Tax=Natranaerobius trueperi TaxID=759412 RepID=A0A226BV44_9FIRM|nr:RNA methyltransferase [Natranaerobius trueperi]OWZ82866.1 hypothetical protein CDO51_11770 [Natranaerobius trueperi]
MITGENNYYIKTYRKLRQKKWRHQQQLVPLEGVKLIEDAFLNNVEFEFILYSYKNTNETQKKLINELCQSGVRCYEIDPQLLKKIAFTETPQGLLGSCKFKGDSLSKIMQSSKNLLVLYNVQDPGNAGTLIRSADAFGFDGVINIKGSVDPTNDKVVRSSMGALFHIPIALNINLEEFQNYLSQFSFRVLFGEVYGEYTLDQLELDDNPIVLVIGNESNGLDGFDIVDDLKKVSFPTKIQMYGNSESLNASVAGSVMMYEVAKKRFY